MAAYECAICLSPPSGAVNQCHSGHLFCARPCYSTLLRSAHGLNCPVCRIPLPDTVPIRNRAIEAELLGRLPAGCACEPECDWRGLAKDKADHESRCMLVKCQSLLDRRLGPLQADNTKLLEGQAALTKENGELGAQVSALLAASATDRKLLAVCSDVVVSATPSS